MEVELTAAEQLVELNEEISQAAFIYVISYEVEGVPLVAGAPETPRLLFGVQDTGSLFEHARRIGNTAGADRGVALPLDGAVVHREFFHPVELTRSTRPGIKRISFRVLQSDGLTLANFTRLLVRMHIYGNQSGEVEIPRAYLPGLKAAVDNAWSRPRDW